MKRTRKSFDLLARPYRLLEFMAFGSELEKARFSLLPLLRSSKRVLLLGDGDGRLLTRLLRESGSVQVDSLELSQGMIQQAQARIRVTDRRRVSFRNEDARHAEYPTTCYDAVVTAFFLDCFKPEEVRTMIDRVMPSLVPGGLWLHVDFSYPTHGWRKLRARAWVGLLYLFFRATTRITARALPMSESMLVSSGLVPIAAREWQAGLLRSVVFRFGQAS